ncbi:MAG TPA: serine/threonine-protein kinase [Coleofasciculaceae cyanobacterium]
MSKRSNYRLLGLVGQGQFGQVFCAVSRQTGRLVALKRLDHQRFPTHKFLRELRFLLSLRHPNIVTCQALEHTATSRHLVMDYCEGGTLRSLMTEENRLNLPQSLKLIADILAGLAHAHSRHIVHCDIKPENILLTVQPLGWTAKISDFGIARLSQEAEERETGNTGSPAYMAPERFYGEYSQTSDLYSVGVLLFELLAGHRPFSGTPAELMAAHLNRPVEIPDAIPDRWRPFILTALQKLSARRFHSAKEMLEALRSIATAEELSRQVQALQIPLLMPASAPPQCVFQSQREQRVDQPVVALAVVENGWYQASIDRAIYQPHVAELPGEEPLATPVVSIPLADPIESLVVRPSGCFVLTRRSVHLMAAPAQSSLAASAGAASILTLPQESVMAISPEADWLAVLSAESQTSALSFWPLSHRPMTVATHAIEIPSGQRSQIQPGLVSPELGSPELGSPELGQLFVLDTRHVALAMPGAGASFTSKVETGTLIKVFTRRGSYVGSLFLPLRIGNAILTSTPYQLLAIDRDHPQLIAVIDLKPYRITRLATGIVPTLLAVTKWGYILANSQGEIALLDLAGRQLGQMLAPEGITAIAPLDQRHLLVATWAGQQGQIYSLDLNEIGADLLF